MIGLAFLPAVAVALRRGRIVAGLALLVALLVAASAAFDIPLTDARPRSDHDFFGPLFDRIHQGFLEFYDTGLPFDRLEFPLMHSLVSLAVFGFVAAAALLLVARRPLAAGIVLLVGAGWPATLSPGERPLAAGALVLAAILAVLFLARGGARAVRGLGSAVVAVVVLIAIGVGASTMDAVAKRAFLGWQRWDLYDAPEDPVGVRYIWSSHYQGVSFPEKETVVLRVRVAETNRKLYWRATTLDEYTGVGWREALPPGRAERAQEVDLRSDPLLPEDAKDGKNWVRQEVTVGALSDNHLIASAQPVKLETGTGAPVRQAQGGVVLLPRGLRIGQRYTAWSYVPDPKPSDLAKAPGRYEQELRRYLELVPGVAFPAWDAKNRDARVERIFKEGFQNFLVMSHRDVYGKAREIVRGAKDPYTATLALEAWFRTRGGFSYSEQPRQAIGAEPPLVNFILRSKQGYCQFYAGSMALMLRLLGVPSRVAAGFTSGTYDPGSKEWIVTDHNAHTWVEVYFPGYGWLPFDPTPGRGELTATYSSVSAAFDRRDAAVPLEGLGEGSFVLTAIQREALLALRGGGVEGAGGFGAPGGSALGDPDEGGSPSIVVLASLVVAGALACLLALKLVRRELRFVTHDPRVLAAACRRDLVGFLADQRLELPPSTTLTELGEVVEREFVVDAGPFVRNVARARFGRPEEAEQAVRRAQRELRTLRARMRGELGITSRVRGALSVRSLTV